VQGQLLLCRGAPPRTSCCQSSRCRCRHQAAAPPAAAAIGCAGWAPVDMQAHHPSIPLGMSACTWPTCSVYICIAMAYSVSHPAASGAPNPQSYPDGAGVVHWRPGSLQSLPAFAAAGHRDHVQHWCLGALDSV
jgi:hypothetical protein